jgi:hypothetical protein
VVRAVQVLNALVKLTELDAVPSNIPSSIVVSAKQDFHAAPKLFPFDKSNGGKLVSPLDCHAVVKLTLLASVPSFAPDENDVRAEQVFQAFEKFEPSGA